jgi:hypothetical protein
MYYTGQLIHRKSLSESSVTSEETGMFTKTRPSANPGDQARLSGEGVQNLTSGRGRGQLQI